MKYFEIIGFLAAILTTVAFFPQDIKVYKTQNTQSISLSMYIVFSIGILLWLVYGFYLNSLPMIIANAITLVSSIYILYMKLKHK
uniref:SemiSWEET transporter n=1 Tax=uncultured Polaribacter sp. TaxID=174711 RepID=UPI00261378CA|nr:SemiSWEET transporter [uncultured Polaribacter sp.]